MVTNRHGVNDSKTSIVAKYKEDRMLRSKKSSEQMRKPWVTRHETVVPHRQIHNATHLQEDELCRNSDLGADPSAHIPLPRGTRQPPSHHRA